jgi:1-acyl-sn-glycerol-3-phosphate acyltransferase
MGYKGIYPAASEFPKYPVLYTFNHSSYLDIFLLTGLGLPNSRFLFSTKTLKFIPLVIAAKALGTYYIPMQDKKEKRLNFLIRITSLIKRKKLSLIASSEGVRPYVHAITRFNRGIYHLALEAKLPIVALFIYIPEDLNPYMGNKVAKGGVVSLEILKEFSTSDWKLENLEYHIETVRNAFVNRFNELNPVNKTA